MKSLLITAAAFLALSFTVNGDISAFDVWIGNSSRNAVTVEVKGTNNRAFSLQGNENQSGVVEYNVKETVAVTVKTTARYRTRTYLHVKADDQKEGTIEITRAGEYELPVKAKKIGGLIIEINETAVQ